MSAIAFFQDHQIQLTDARRGNFPLAIVHEMAKSNKNQRKRPTARTWAQVSDRALGMDVTIEKEGRTTFLNPPSIIGGGYYAVTTATQAWTTLDQIAAQLTAAMPNEQVFALSTEYKADLL
jgi:hypothetical protein